MEFSKITQRQRLLLQLETCKQFEEDIKVLADIVPKIAEAYEKDNAHQIRKLAREFDNIKGCVPCLETNKKCMKRKQEELAQIDEEFKDVYYRLFETGLSMEGVVITDNIESYIPSKQVYVSENLPQTVIYKQNKTEIFEVDKQYKNARELYTETLKRRETLTQNIELQIRNNNEAKVLELREEYAKNDEACLEYKIEMDTLLPKRAMLLKFISEAEGSHKEEYQRKRQRLMENIYASICDKCRGSGKHTYYSHREDGYETENCSACKGKGMYYIFRIKDCDNPVHSEIGNGDCVCQDQSVLYKQYGDCDLCVNRKVLYRKC